MNFLKEGITIQEVRKGFRELLDEMPINHKGRAEVENTLMEIELQYKLNQRGQNRTYE
jgi:predicted transcriptional regulator